MKRHANLWHDVIFFAGLLRAAEKAQRGKRFQPFVAAFHFNLARELWTLHEDLSTKSYRPGLCLTFIIHESKPRQISAASYRDRVVLHALVNVLEPIYQQTFIPDSYAWRRVKASPSSR
jgi:retron-type reverse transcriptase